MDDRQFFALAEIIMILCGLTLLIISGAIGIYGDWDAVRNSGIPNPVAIGFLGIIMGILILLFFGESDHPRR